MSGLPRHRVLGTLAPDDRAFQYGDGVFETLVVVRGAARRVERHLARLEAGCRALGFEAPALAGAIAEMTAGVERAVLKVVVSRGAGPRGYRPPDAPTPLVALSVHPFPEWPPAWNERGIVARWCDTRVSEQPRLAGLKHLNRLEQVLARAEWSGFEPQEGLMCNARDELVAATQANVFCVRGGALVTPPVDRCGIAGITRALVIDGARELDIPCDEAVVPRAAVEAADELFVCNSVIGIWPVRALGARAFDAPGSVTVRLQRWLDAR